ncbi:MAG: signal peptide peptidase SppA [Bacteroidales bacterium]|jgi:protease-4|nr:signal peptide peptidase SppA [Bacteroidales bacterium]
MAKFFKYLLASFLGCIVALFIMFSIMMGIFSAMASFGNKPVAVKENTILRIDLDTKIVERSPQGTIPSFDYLNMQSKQVIGLNDILMSIRKAKEDPKIKGIYLNLTYIPAGIATVEEIRNALLDFKESGKFIISYSDTYTQKAYYLATVSDQIYLNPLGDFIFKGMSSQITFYKKALEKLDVDVQIIRHGKFKSAVEPFMMEGMSKENREQTISYVGSIWNSLLKTISESRKLSESQLNEWIDKLEVHNATSAKEKGLIDGVRYYDEVLDELKEKSGVESVEKLQFISLSKYRKAFSEKKQSKSGQKIAVIYAEGDIVMGSGSNDITSEDFSKAIRKARKDTTVKAIVLRINSGGGSALASDIISREVQLASGIKPVIASFGDVAASGGYYIATQADMIIADPTTITGSIGVFGMVPNLKGFMNKKLGLTFDEVVTNKHADFVNPMRPLSAEERNLLQLSVEDIYDTFITRVSTGRNMEKDSVDAIGQGRVWDAVAAKRLGLIDDFGGISDAIRMAAEKAGISDYTVKELPEQSNPLASLLSSLSEEMRMRTVQKELGEYYKHYHQLKYLIHSQGVQARMPYEIELY